MHKKIFAALFLPFFLFGCLEQINIAQNAQPGKSPGTLITTAFTTTDGVAISAKNYNALSKKSVILTHMLGSSKDAWNNFAVQLSEKGFNVLSIDLRGHGQSGGGNYSTFSDAQWNAATNDIQAAAQYLKEQDKEEICIIGASIGANLALNYAASDQSIKKIVLLSPGLDYHGVKTSETIKQYGNRKILFAASSEDEYAFSSAQALFESAGSGKEFKQLDGKGHGTQMLENSDLAQFTIAWIEK